MSVIELYDPAIPLTRSKLKKLKRKGLLPDYALPQISPSYQLKNIRPKTINQNWIFKEYAAGKNLMVHGYPGTGKTFLALYLALNDFNYSKVIIIRSVVPSRDIGFLPGTEEEKAAIYEKPYEAIFADLYGRADAYRHFKHMKRVDFETTSFLRGTTFNDSIVIVDECENLEFKELDTVITRMGQNCRIMFCGDFRQTDLEGPRKDGLKKFMGILDKMKEFSHIEMSEEDIVRSGIVRSYIMEKMRNGICS